MNEHVGTLFLIGITFTSFATMAAYASTWCPHICDSHHEGTFTPSGTHGDDTAPRMHVPGDESTETQPCDLRITRTAIITDNGVKLVPRTICAHIEATP